MKRLLVVLLLSLAPSAWAQQSLVQAEVPDRPASGALGALNDAVTVNISGRIGVGGYVATGTLSGTVTPEVTIDGTNWLPTSVFTFSAGAAPARASTVTLNTLFGIELPNGAKQARIRVSAYTSGTSTGTLLATLDVGARVVAVAGTITTTPPANASTNVAQVAGTATDVNSGAKSAGTMRVVLATDQPALTNKLLVTPDSVALPANQSTNVAQVAGTATDVNSGVKSAGTIRVVLATDQPALTNKLLVTPDALPANQSTNVAQVAGTATDVNSGVKSAGTMRVVLATDQPALTNKLLVTPDSVALPANQTVNVAQVAGTATDTNSGNKSAGTQRMVLATDQPNLTSALNVNCTAGCSGSSFADSSAFTFATTPVSNTAFVVDDVATNTVAENSAGAARMNTNRILYVDLSKTVANTNKLLVTPDSVALPANQSTNVAQVAGTATDVNSGVKSAGTIRVVLATDQPALTNKLLVTPDSVALPANQTVNVAQMAGTTTDTNSGVKSAGTLRVVLATDQPALTNKLLVTPDSVALPANQSTNVAQIAGTNTVTGGVGGLIAVGGNVANAGAATANPVPVGGIFTTTPATLTTGQTATAQFTAAQNLKHDLSTVAGTATDTNSGVKSAGTMRVVLATDQPALTNKLLVTPDSVALPANQSVNVAQVAGTATDVNSGNKSAGTQRMVIATDQPNLTTALNVNCTSGCVAGGSFADSAAFTFATTAVSNTAFVVDDVATNTVAENSAGAARMNTNRILYVDLSKTVANTNKLLVTPDSVALPANQSVNVAQVAGTATSVNNGTVDAGTQRVTIASDSTGKVTVTPVAVSTSNNDGTCTSVAANTTVLASFATRKGAVIMAQCDPSACNTDTTFIKLAATATTADFPLAPGDKFVLQGSAVYTGIIDAIANSGTQKICVMEF